MADENVEIPVQEQVNAEAESVAEPAAVVEAEVQQSSEGEQLEQKVEDVKIEDAPSASAEEEVKEAPAPAEEEAKEAPAPEEQPAEQQESQATEESAKEEEAPAPESAPAETAIEPQPVQEGEKVEAA